MTSGKKITVTTVVLLSIILLGMGYRYSPYKLEYLGHYDRIWAHRVNSTEKLKSAQKYFKGIEVDVVYDDKNDVLDVGHPPSPSINLDLEKYISLIGISEKPNIWLDIKNLNAENGDLILKKLVQIFSKYNYPLEKVLVETRYPEILQSFSDSGFKTSFYLPYGLTEKNSNDKDAEIRKIKTILQNQPSLAISSDYKDYDIMKEYFPEKDKYLWIINSVTKHGFSTPRKVFKDSTVKAVLISYKTWDTNR